jgi:hypothetical protein
MRAGATDKMLGQRTIINHELPSGISVAFDDYDAIHDLRLTLAMSREQKRIAFGSRATTGS